MVRSSIVLSALTLIVGVAVGYLVGATRTEPTETAVPAASVGPSGSRTSQEADAVPAPSKRTRAATYEGPSTAPSKSDTTPSAAAGDGAIQGTVVGPEGAPLVGVVIRAEAYESDEDLNEEPMAPSLPGSPPPRTDIALELRKLESKLRREEARVRETTTDSRGSYVMNGLVGSVFNVRAWLAGYRIERVDGKSSTTLPEDGRCDFKATSLRAITVSVLLPDGTPAKVAELSWTSGADGDGKQSEWCPDAPVLALEPGTYVVTAAAGVQEGRDSEVKRRPWPRWRIWEARIDRSGKVDAPLYRSEAQSVVVTADTPRDLTIRLTSQPAIRAKVVFTSSDPRIPVRIAAVRMDAGSVAETSMLLGEGSRVKARWLEDQDETVLTGLEPGTYLVGVTLRGGLIGQSTTIVVGNDIATATLQLGGAVRDWVKVWVRGPDGSLVREAQIDCGCKGSEGRGDWSLDATPEEDGSFRISNYERDGPYSGSGGSFGGTILGDGKRTYYVRANSTVYGSVEAAYDPATDREVSLQFVEPARLRASVIGYSESQNRSRIMLTLSQMSEDVSGRGSSHNAEIDARGIATFPPVKPGSYEVVTTLAKDDGTTERRWRSRWDGTEVARVPVVLASGDAALDVAMPKVIDLVVSFDPGLDPKSIQLQRVADDGSVSRIADAKPSGGEHEVEFRDLVVVPGRHRLVSRSVGDMWIDLPGPTRVVFRPRPFNALQVRMRESGKGYLAEAGLQVGDVVVAVDGSECQNSAQIDEVLAVAKTHEKATLTVLRGGRRIDVPVDPRRLGDGGYMAPWVR